MSIVQIKTELPFDELLRAVEQLTVSDLDKLMNQVVSLRAKQRTQPLTEKESDLLIKINQGLPPEHQNRYDVLVKKRQDETLTEAEHEELLSLTDRIEQSDARRMEWIAKLAMMKGKTLPSMMKDLGIFRQKYV